MIFIPVSLSNRHVTTPTSGLATTGANFFLNSTFSATVRAIAKFFQPHVSTDGPYLTTGGQEGRARPPK